MQFSQLLTDSSILNKKLSQKYSKIDIIKIINKETIDFSDFLALLKNKDYSLLPLLAKKAKYLTEKYFGKTIHFYVPLYLSNYCENSCLYCGFNCKIKQKRKKLNFAEISSELKVIKQKGFSHILLLTGESPQKLDLDYLKKAIKQTAKEFEQISLEIMPLEIQEYQELIKAGASGLTVYQETYQRDIYEKVHQSGKKKDFLWRLATPQRALDAGFFKIGLGVLLGLADPLFDLATLALHLRFLQKKYWQNDFSVSFPRLKNYPTNFKPNCLVSDKQFMNFIFAFRLFFPSLNLILSTREKAELRNDLIGIGINQMSAESKTNPGGYFANDDISSQFETEDKRTLKTMLNAVSQKGYDPVLKDWEKGLGL